MRTLRAAAVTALFIALTASPSWAAGEVAIEDLDLSAWPRVDIEVSGGESDEFTVTENGTQISDVTVRSFEETGTRVEVILAIDTSGSMEGPPHAASLEAARRFIDSVPPNISVGLVTFADDAKLVVAPTTDRTRTQNALERLSAVGETALYDGVWASVAAFGKADQRNIVLLSDGADTVSTRSIGDAIGSARRNGVAVYTVGLRSGEFDVSALRRLASKTGGEYSAADVSTLNDMFTGLAGTIENQYVLNYRSAAESGKEFTLQIASPDGSDERLLLAPQMDAPQRRVAPEIPADPLLQGTVGLVVVLTTSFLALALIAYTLMSSTTQQRRDRKLARLMAAAPPAEENQSEDKRAAGWLPDPLVNAAEGMATNRGWNTSLDHKLERAGSHLKAGEMVASSLVFAIGGLIVGVLLGSFLLAVALGLVGGLAPNVYLTVRGNRRFSAFESQLPDILMVLASSLRAGHSFLQALDSVATELPDPGGPEFARVVAEIRLGRPLREAMDDLAERVGSEDFKWAILAVNIQREVGGNLAEVLDTLAGTIRDRDYVRRQIKVLSAEGKLSMFILGALPVGVAGWMTLVNPKYIGLLINTGLGLVMTTMACALLVLGFLWMRKVVRIDV